MYLYSLTLQQATAITCCIYGNFSAPRAQEILIARGMILELWRPDDTCKLQCMVSTNVFGHIRSLIPFRLTGGTRDYIVVGSDSGRITVLEFNETSKSFSKVHMETFGKSGCRRIVPGQFLCGDPRGRAIMIGAVEKQKLVYVLNRDATARLTISSPLEAHKGHTVCFHMTGVDVGFDNPIFAAIEYDYSEYHSDDTEKVLTFYELDLGLNHVARKWSEPVDPSANLLITVPGGSDGPGGVLVCSENMLCWRNQNHPERRFVIPRRKDVSLDEPLLIIAAATHKQKDFFFFLLQSELGDLYKVTLQYKNDIVEEIVMSYFDTIPPATALVVLRTGFLFAASEFGNHALYQFIAQTEEEEDMWEALQNDVTYTLFQTRPLKNLQIVDEMDSLCPIMDLKVEDLAKEDSAQFYALVGRGSRSSMKVLRHGLSISQMAESPLPGNPNAVWTTKRALSDEFDKYIVVSFAHASLVLQVGETVTEVTDSGFLGTTPTIAVGLIGEDNLVQVHPNGIRVIRSNRRINEWQPPGRRQIVHSALNNQQVVITLSGATGELFYFELDAMGNLNEIERRELGRDVACVDIAPLSHGRRARFLAVGDFDNTVRILSLTPDSCLQQVAIQAVPIHPESLALIEMRIGTAEEAPTLFLHVGLRNGVMLRTVVDSVTGDLSDTRTRFLGARPVKVFKVTVQDTPAVLALSSRSWLCYNYQTRHHTTPLSYAPLEYATNLTSDQCPEGIVALAQNTLRIFTFERLGEAFNYQDFPLRYTPRKMLLHPTTKHFVIIETDHNAYNENERAAIKAEAMSTEEEPPPDLDTRIFGVPRPGPGHWASCLRIMDYTLRLLSLDISFNNLTRLRPEMGSCTTLTSLNARRNLIWGLPSTIGNLSNLTFFDLSGNSLSIIPPQLSMLSNLRSIGLSGTSAGSPLDEVVAGLCAANPTPFCFLEELILCGARLSRLPEGITTLKSLRTLNLYKNKFVEIPKMLGQLPCLEVLNMGHNRLSVLNENDLGSLTNLRHLYLGNDEFSSLDACTYQVRERNEDAEEELEANSIASLPEYLGYLSHLETLSLNFNKLEIIPGIVAALTSLRTLHVHNCVLANPPTWQNSISTLQSLTSLDIGNVPTIHPADGTEFTLNKLVSLPSLKPLKNLKELRIRGCMLSSTFAPVSCFSTLTSLELLDISSNVSYSGDVGDSIGHLVSLVTLNASHNHISRISPKLAQLRNLTSLDFSSNNLSTFPKEVASLPRLSFLNLDCNSFDSHELKIIREEFASVAEVIASSKKDRERTWRSKAVSTSCVESIESRKRSTQTARLSLESHRTNALTATPALDKNALPPLRHSRIPPLDP